ncbi:MAG TPA: tetratricopeptide repeat protein [Gemmatimonadaceae bacterium]
MSQKQRKRKARQQAQSTAPRTPMAEPFAQAQTDLYTLPVLGITSGLIVLVAAIYAQVRSFEFVYLDDHLYVYENAFVLKGLSLGGIKWALTTNAAGNWHPLTWISHMIDVSLFGKDPGLHHVTSAVIHAINSALLFLLLCRLTGRTWLSAIVAALFAIHPLHVESVAWVSERKDVLSTFFWFVTIHLYVTYTRKPNAITYAGVIVGLALGLMSKPMVVTLPFALLLLDYWPLRRIHARKVASIKEWIPLIREKVPLFILVLISMIVTVKVQRGYGAVVRVTELSFGDRFANAITAYVSYLADLFWPAGLAAFYPFSRPSGLYVVVALLIVIGVSAVSLLHARKRPYILTGWAWFLGTLIPVIGIVQVGDQARADRYTYVPAVGIFIVITWLGAELAARSSLYRWASTALAAGALSVLTCLSIKQTEYWRNNMLLFSHAVDVTKNNYRAEALLGVAYSARERHEEAIKHYDKSLAIREANAEVHLNRGGSLYTLGRKAEALVEFEKAVRYKPDAAVNHYNYALLLNEAGRTREALSEAQIAARLNPSSAQFREAVDVIASNAKQAR